MTFSPADKRDGEPLIFELIVSVFPVSKFIWISTLLCLFWGMFVRFVSMCTWD